MDLALGDNFDFTGVNQASNFLDFNLDQYMQPADWMSQMPPQQNTFPNMPSTSSASLDFQQLMPQTQSPLNAQPLSWSASGSSIEDSPPAVESSTASGRSKNTKVSPDLVRKRERNNIAARKYRQKRIDRITELEEQLAAMQRERDDLRVELARKDSENSTLRELIGGKGTASK